MLSCAMMILQGGTAMAFTVTSPAFREGGSIDEKFTCDGADLSPELKWSDVPAGTKSLVVIMDDPDAPPGNWVHWVLYDLPGDATGIKEDLPKKETLENGARHGLCWGVNDFSRVGYFGPCPPPGKPHRYFFKVYALDMRLELPPRIAKTQVEQKMKGHILAEAQLMGKYGR